MEREELNREELKKAVLKAAGIWRLGPWNCQLLSRMIFEKTGRQVSVSTLKRFFGFASQQVETSLYTLAALEEFCQERPLKKMPLKRQLGR